MHDYLEQQEPTGVHGWDYRLDCGISQYNNKETSPKFGSWLEDGQVIVDEDKIAVWAADHPLTTKSKKLD